MIKITSRKNALVMSALDLHDKKVRDSENLFFTEGKKLYLEGLLWSGAPKTVFVTEEYYEKNPDITADEIYLVTSDVYAKISDEKSPEGIFAIFKKPEIKASGKSSLILLEGIQDPGNLGTILRTAVAFGVSEVLTVGCADVYSPKTVRSTMGAVFKIPTRSFENIDFAVEYARGVSEKIIATALHHDSIPLEETDTAFATIMIGSEGRGLSERAIALADEKVIIPMENTESLNASVAAALCMYHSMMKRKGVI